MNKIDPKKEEKEKKKHFRITLRKITYFKNFVSASRLM